jgi:hypothetical protein
MSRPLRAQSNPRTASPSSPSLSPTCPPLPNGASTGEALRQLFTTTPWLPPALTPHAAAAA